MKCDRGMPKNIHLNTIPNTKSQDRIITMVQKLALDPLADVDGDGNITTKGSSTTLSPGGGSGGARPAITAAGEGTGERGMDGAGGGYGRYETTVIAKSIGKITRASLGGGMDWEGGVSIRLCLSLLITTNRPPARGLRHRRR